MTYREIEKAVSQKDITAMQDGDQLLHFLALTGLLKMFSDGTTSKEQASDIKRLLREDYEADTQTERITRDELMEVSEIQDKIRKAILLGVDNPWVLLIQSAKCISILLNDGDFFYGQVRKDCYAIYGDAYGDQKTKEAERKDLEASIQKLEKCITETKDKGTKHLLSRAVSLHKQRI